MRLPAQSAFVIFHLSAELLRPHQSRKVPGKVSMPIQKIWPVAVNVAAGLVLAVVIAWQFLGGLADQTSSHTSPFVAQGPADVNEARLVHADSEPGNWMAYGRTYDEQ